MASVSMTAKNGAEVQNIVQELERQRASRKDYVVPAKDLQVVTIDNRPHLTIASDFGPAALEIRKIAYEQLFEKAGIPNQYGWRMKAEQPDLMAANVNTWMKAQNKAHLVRTIDGDARAVLSDRFRTLDSYDLFFETFPVIKDSGGSIVRADLTEEHFYLKAVINDWEERIDNWEGGPNDGPAHFFRKTNPDNFETVVPGVVISNSEVGRGGLKAEFFLWFGQCSNGAILDRSLYKVHTGRQLDAGFLSEETKELEDRTIWSQVRDLVKSVFDREQFQKLVKTMQNAAMEELAEPVKAVDAVVQHYGWSDADRQAILNELIAPKSRELNPGLTTYGLVQAVTQMAHRSDVEAGIEFERAGGELLTGAASKIIGAYREREMVPVSARSEAARKAAQTRRANAIAVR